MSYWSQRLASLQRLLQQHLQHGTGEVGCEVLVVDGDHALAGLEPDAGDGVLALAGGVGAAQSLSSFCVPTGAAACGSAPLTAGKVGEGLCFGCHGSQTLTFLRLSFATSSFSGFCAVVRMLAALVDLEVAHQLALQRPAREHALDGLLEDALGELAVEDLARRALLDAARIAGVPVVDLVVTLGAGEDDLLGVDDDDVVAAVDVRRVDRSCACP